MQKGVTKTQKVVCSDNNALTLRRHFKNTAYEKILNCFHRLHDDAGCDDELQQRTGC